MAERVPKMVMITLNVNELFSLVKIVTIYFLKSAICNLDPTTRSYRKIAKGKGTQKTLTKRNCNYININKLHFKTKKVRVKKHHSLKTKYSINQVTMYLLAVHRPLPIFFLCYCFFSH